MSVVRQATHPLPSERAELAPKNRTHVLWIGGTVPNTLKGGCFNRDLELHVTSSETLDRDAPNARALILEYSPRSDFQEWACALVAVALRHGLAVAITKPDGVDTVRYEADTAPLTSGLGRVARFHGNYESTAQFALMHDPGPGASSMVRLEGDKPSDDEALTLLHRALFDFSVVHLQLLKDGKSGARVWLVRPGEEDTTTRSQPWLMKLHNRDSIDRERSNIISLVENQIPWQQRPTLSAGRCVAGSTDALLVQDFIEHAQPLRSALPSHLPDALFGALFGRTLRPWTRASWLATEALGKQFERIGALRWSGGLSEAAEVAVRNCGCHPLDRVKQSIMSWPVVSHRQSTIHADLHAANLFVDGPASVCVIDFEKVTHGPMVADPACLEVSIAFGAPGPECPPRSRLPVHGTEVGLAWLRTIYRYPLAAAHIPGLPQESWRADAVRAIRGEARKLEDDPFPYACAITCYLLRFASFDDNPLEDRTFAYELAAALADDIDTEFDRRQSGGRTNGNDAQ